jgi:hypothetical protein
MQKLNSVGSKSEAGVQLWKTWTIMWTSVLFEEALEREKKNVSAKDNSDHDHLKQNKPWFD